MGIILYFCHIFLNVNMFSSRFYIFKRYMSQYMYRYIFIYILRGFSFVTVTVYNLAGKHAQLISERPGVSIECGLIKKMF